MLGRGDVTQISPENSQTQLIVDFWETHLLAKDRS